MIIIIFTHFSGHHSIINWVTWLYRDGPVTSWPDACQKSLLTMVHGTRDNEGDQDVMSVGGGGHRLRYLPRITPALAVSDIRCQLTNLKREYDKYYMFSANNILSNDLLIWCVLSVTCRRMFVTVIQCPCHSEGHTAKDTSMPLMYRSTRPTPLHSRT